MNKADLIEALAPTLGGRPQAASAVEAMVDVILREVAGGGSVGITGFGTFEKVDRAPRTGRNPRTGEPVPIPGTSSPRFRPGTYFKDAVADPATLPKQGLAGARVGSTSESAAPAARSRAAGSAGTAGAPASVRRSTSAAGTGKAADTSKAAGKASAGKAATGKATADKATTAKAAAGKPATRTTKGSGTPASVKKQPAPAPTAAAKTAKTAKDAVPAASEPATGGRVLSGGEEITQGMISLKKAQLAKVKNDEVVAGAKAEKKKDKKAKKDKKSGKDKKKGKKDKKS